MKNTITNQQRKAIYRREGYQCAICSSTQHLQVHHAVPRGRGGTDNEENLICLCAVCHGMAHDVMPNNLEQWSQEDMEQAIIEYLADMYPGTWAFKAFDGDPISAVKWECNRDPITGECCECGICNKGELAWPC